MPANLPPSHDAAWIKARAAIVSASATPAERIDLARDIAMREDLSLHEGTIDVDLEPPRASQFAGIGFRVGSAADYAIVYLTPSVSADVTHVANAAHA